MTQQWLYKATNAIASLDQTRALAVEDGFLCKAHFEAGGTRQKADLVDQVHHGDVIHFYYVDGDGSAHVLGSFEVVSPRNSLHPARFSGPVGHTDLVRVVDDAFAERLKAMGYEDDARLRYLTGWAIRPAATAVAPPYATDLFSGRQVIRRHP
jgi:hypothetical protein